MASVSEIQLNHLTPNNVIEKNDLDKDHHMDSISDNCKKSTNDSQLSARSLSKDPYSSEAASPRKSESSSLRRSRERSETPKKSIKNESGRLQSTIERKRSKSNDRESNRGRKRLKSIERKSRREQSQSSERESRERSIEQETKRIRKRSKSLDRKSKRERSEPIERKSRQRSVEREIKRSTKRSDSIESTVRELKRISKRERSHSYDERSDPFRKTPQRSSNKLRRSKSRSPPRRRRHDRSNSGSLRRSLSMSPRRASPDFEFSNGSRIKTNQRSKSPRTPSPELRFERPNYDSKYELFSELKISKQILDGIQSMNIFELNRFQKAVLPPILKHPNTSFYIQAKPSFGKKIAYLIAACQQINPMIREPQALIIVPSADLALRLIRVVRSMTYYSKIQSKIIISDYQNSNEPIHEHLVICTSGILLHNLSRNDLFDINRIRITIYDEFPILTASEKSHYYIRELLNMKNNCQLIFFSANFDPNYELRLIQRFTKNLRCVNLLEKNDCFSGMLQYYIMCRDMGDKNKTLSKIFERTSVEKAMVFVSDKKGSTIVANELHHKGFKTFLLTSDVSVNKRLDEIRTFETSRSGILILTYPLSIGLDLTRVHMVINYDLPLENDNFFFEYFYRVLECSRPGNSYVVNLVDNQTKSRVRELEDYFAIKISKFDIY